MLGFRGRGRMKANVCAWFVVALTGIGVVSCDGGGILGGGNGDSCRSNDDCGSDLYCFGPNRPNVCGIPPREFCASNADCPMGDVCQAIFDSCSQDGLGSECNVHVMQIHVVWDFVAMPGEPVNRFHVTKVLPVPRGKNAIRRWRMT